MSSAGLCRFALHGGWPSLERFAALFLKCLLPHHHREAELLAQQESLRKYQAVVLQREQALYMAEAKVEADRQALAKKEVETEAARKQWEGLRAEAESLAGFYRQNAAAVRFGTSPPPATSLLHTRKRACTRAAPRPCLSPSPVVASQCPRGRTDSRGRPAVRPR